MKLKMWMLRSATVGILDALSLSKMVGLMNSDDSYAVGAVLYGWMLAVWDWMRISYDALDQVRLYCDDYSDDVYERMVQVRMAREQLEFIIDAVRACVIGQNYPLDLDLIVKWYIDARMLLNKVRRLLDIPSKCEGVDIDLREFSANLLRG